MPISHRGNRSAVQGKHQVDFTMMFSIILLSLFGLVMITSSSFYYAYNRFGNSYKFFFNQLKWISISMVAMFFMMNFDYTKLMKWSRIIYFVSNLLLVAVLIFGTDINGSKRWLDIGPFAFQPSELAKLAIIISMSTYVYKNNQKMKKMKYYIRGLLIIGVPVILIAIQNFSTAIVLIAIGLAILFIGGIKIKHLLVTGLPIVAIAGFFVALPLLNIKALKGISDEFSYRLGRVMIWRDPWKDPRGKGFQTIQSLYAVGSGGLFGTGLGKSIQKRGFIPEAHNDIIFSIICEELGLLGAALVLFLFIILIWKGIKVAINAADLFGSLLVTGVIAQVATQVVINVAVNTNTIPVTGMPLPFISYGGSSLLFLMIGMGIVLNVSRYAKK